ncbi:rhodanese-related sulfurtransferase [Alkalicoccus chagannorensis]|uniref:oxygen-dependent tRNA uridine(34) hydroxylase TrhO n=1 Tax=Alkalicoccus chagannorensis TaxID=427072 RepID=UPI0003FA0307|nr:rhodanese-related sulfurtransferase [Alkalicoccus chagannorensis]
MSSNYQVLLYYLYTDINNPEEKTQEHLEYCKSLGLRGRILIAGEGINGTVSGTVEQTEQYMEDMKADPLFQDITFKIDEADEHAFKKMHVRHRPELVTLRLEEEDVDPRQVTGRYLKPKEWLEKLQDPDTVVLDARNKYEYDLGHFEGAIRPDIDTFRELPEWVDENRGLLEGKEIMTYCTGGIRCEKFSGWLKEKGFDQVNHLEGGIITYGKDPEAKGRLWKGQCYVFDERISVPVNQEEHVVVGRDHFDGEPCERYINCANPDCNDQILASEENEVFYLGGCSHECRIHPRNRFIEMNSMKADEVAEQLQRIEAYLGETAR